MVDGGPWFSKGKQSLFQVYPSGRKQVYLCTGVRGICIPLCLSRESGGLLGASHSDFEGGSIRDSPLAWPGEGPGGNIFSRFYLGGLRRSAGASAKRRLLGQLNAIGPRRCD